MRLLLDAPLRTPPGGPALGAGCVPRASRGSRPGTRSPGTRAGLTTRAFSDIRLPFLVFVVFLVLPSFLSRFKWLPTGTSSAISVPSVLPPLAPQRDTMDALLNAAACVARTLFLWLHSARLQSTVLFFVAAHYREKSVERMWRW